MLFCQLKAEKETFQRLKGFRSYSQNILFVSFWNSNIFIVFIGKTALQNRNQNEINKQQLTCNTNKMILSCTMGHLFQFSKNAGAKCNTKDTNGIQEIEKPLH